MGAGTLPHRLGHAPLIAVAKSFVRFEVALCRHSGVHRNPVFSIHGTRDWTPAFAGVTVEGTSLFLAIAIVVSPVPALSCLPEAITPSNFETYLPKQKSILKREPDIATTS